MGDERHVIGLVGKLLNASDELSAAAVASDTFNETCARVVFFRMTRKRWSVGSRV
jgi:hypothetical protein